jgi:hypothetical protein
VQDVMYFKRFVFMACSAILFFGGGCADAEVAQLPAQPVTTTTPTNPGTTPDPGTTPTAPNQLRFMNAMGDDGLACLSTCSIQLTSQKRALSVRYSAGNGAPISGALVTYLLEDPAQIGSLTGVSTFTDMNGVATVEIVPTGLGPGSAIVSVNVPGDFGVPTLFFSLAAGLTSDGPSLLDVTWSYAGIQAPEHFQVNLYGPTNAPSCAQVHPDIQPGGIVPTLTNGPLTFNGVAQFPALPGGGGGTWTVQVMSPYGGSATVHGCTAGVATTPGSTKQIKIPTVDLPLRFEGVYGVYTTIDMVEGLQGTDYDIMATVLQAFDNPGLVALQIACDNQGGTLGTLCDFIVDENGQLSPTGAMLADAADEAFLSLMADQLGSDFLFDGQALNNLLNAVILESTLTLTNGAVDPDGGPNNPLSTNNASEIWHTARATWEENEGCTIAGGVCKEIVLDLAALYGTMPAANLHASVDSHSRLHIDAHEIEGLNYGLLVNGFIESEVLPMLFGQSGGFQSDIDSYEDLVATLFGSKGCVASGTCCSEFTAKLEDQIPLWILPTIPGACEQAISVAGEWLRERISDMGGDLIVGTPNLNPCQGYALSDGRWVTHLGAQKLPCQWDAQFGEVYGEFTPAATWYGLRP